MQQTKKKRKKRATSNSSCIELSIYKCEAAEDFFVDGFKELAVDL